MPEREYCYTDSNKERQTAYKNDRYKGTRNTPSNESSYRTDQTGYWHHTKYTDRN